MLPIFLEVSRFHYCVVISKKRDINDQALFTSKADRVGSDDSAGLSKPGVTRSGKGQPQSAVCIYDSATL